MKFAYADPPYLGTAKRTYGKVHPEAAAYDDPETHRRLIERLQDEFPDGWALSLHEPSLRVILPMTPKGARVGVWTCGNAKSFPHGGHAISRHWEPVIWIGGRRGDYRCSDTLHTSSHVFRGLVDRDLGKRDRFRSAGVAGYKPAAFCDWIFALLGAERGDEFHDLFPGSGAVSAAWARFCGQQPDLPLTPLEQLIAE